MSRDMLVLVLTNVVSFVAGLLIGAGIIVRGAIALAQAPVKP